jgi:ArsR family transcriptional regulator, arsenate/arsenite/antimonite-responsive transcriptional repressor
MYRCSSMTARGVPVEVRTIEACCSPLLAGPLDEQQATELGVAFKALADPVRLQLLSLIAAAPEGSACSCHLEEPVGKSQPTVSHHLTVLAEAGLITKEKVGRWVYCSVVPERLAVLRDALGG